MKAFEIVMGRKAALMRVLTVEELLIAGRSLPASSVKGGGEAAAAVMGNALGREALRMAVVRIGEVNADGGIIWTRELAHNDMVGGGWAKLFRSRETFALLRAWTGVHMPTEQDTAAAVGSLEVDPFDDPITATATAPGLGEVVMRELDVDEVAVVMQIGAGERSTLVADIMQTREGLRRSLQSVGGRPVDVDSLSTRDLFLLGSLWKDLHVGDAGSMGEVRAVSTSGD